MNTRLQNGDRFPDLSISLVGGGQVVLPRDVEGLYSVILFYRGAWCPYCKAQLAAFARARASLQSIGVEIVAVSVDDEAVTRRRSAEAAFEITGEMRRGPRDGRRPRTSTGADCRKRRRTTRACGGALGATDAKNTAGLTSQRMC